MPVYNAENYIKASVDSILNQSLGDFELLIVDDASSDDTINILSRYSDKRISIFRSEENMGYIYHLNRMLSLSKGGFIARMDADDISMPERLQAQVDFLKRNDRIGVLGTNGIKISTKNIELGNLINPTHPEAIRASLFFGNCIIHPSVMFRSSLYERGLIYYNDSYHPAEDYKLWTSLSLNRVMLSNLNSKLIQYRLSSKQTVVTNRNKVLLNGINARVEYLIGYLGSLDKFNLVKEDLLSFCLNQCQEKDTYLKCLNLYDNLISSKESNLFNSTIAYFLKQHLNMNYIQYPYIVNWYKQSRACSLKSLSIKDRVKFFLRN